MDESKTSKFAFAHYHTQHMARLCSRLAALCTDSSRSRELYETAARHLTAQLDLLNFSTGGSQSKKVNQYHLSVWKLAHVQMRLAEIEAQSLLNALKRDPTPNRDLLLSVLQKYKAV